MRTAIPTVILGLAGIGLSVGLPAAAGTAQTSTASYQAVLNPLNHANGSGDFMMTLTGSTAMITEHVSGLAATFNGSPYPHVQHIHIGGQGQCPTTAADTNHDGVISTTEGQPAYGPIGTTLSTSGDTSPKAGTTLSVAPSGATFTYSRTFTLDATTLAAVQAGNAVIVVHGLDPSTLSKQAQSEKSDLVPSLPLAATSPALCGPVAASQMSSTPVGSSPTGGGSTAGLQDGTLFEVGGGLLLAAGAALIARRRVSA